MQIVYPASVVDDNNLPSFAIHDISQFKLRVVNAPNGLVVLPITVDNKYDKSAERIVDQMRNILFYLAGCQINGSISYFSSENTIHLHKIKFPSESPQDDDEDANVQQGAAIMIQNESYSNS